MPKMVNDSPETRVYVLDSYALLAYFEAEPGSELVKSLLESAREGNYSLFMCVVNLGEIIYIVERERGLPKAQEILARIDELPIQIVEVDRTLTLAAAHLKMQYPIAYADCFAAALSLIKKASLVTGDPEFRKIRPECNLRIKWITG
jgi:predicted nucleic acid-binding protein